MYDGDSTFGPVWWDENGIAYHLSEFRVDEPDITDSRSQTAFMPGQPLDILGKDRNGPQPRRDKPTEVLPDEIQHGTHPISDVENAFGMMPNNGHIPATADRTDRASSKTGVEAMHSSFPVPLSGSTSSIPPGVFYPSGSQDFVNNGSPSLDDFPFGGSYETIHGFPYQPMADPRPVNVESLRAQLVQGAGGPFHIAGPDRTLCPVPAEGAFPSFFSLDDSADPANVDSRRSIASQLWPNGGPIPAHMGSQRCFSDSGAPAPPGNGLGNGLPGTWSRSFNYLQDSNSVSGIAPVARRN